MNTFITVNNTTATNHQKAFVPCVPVAVSSVLVAALPLAKRLAARTPSLANLSRADLELIEAKKLALLAKTEECSQTIEALIGVSIGTINELFFSLALSLQFEGQRQEAAAMCASDTFNAVLQATLVQCENQTKHARDEVNALITQLGLTAQDIHANGVICTGKLLDACLHKLESLQGRWKDNCLQSLELNLQLQLDCVYGSVADCLTDVCEFGLDDQLCLEPVPQAQEDALVAMSIYRDLPFSGTWPVLMDGVELVNTDKTESESTADSVNTVGEKA